jgi:hypothetical protein
LSSGGPDISDWRGLIQAIQHLHTLHAVVFLQHCNIWQQYFKALTIFISRFERSDVQKTLLDIKAIGRHIAGLN